MYRTLFKPVFDFFLTCVVFALTSPLFLMVSLLLALFQNGNIFFTQDRPGKNERIFRLVKFKTMNDKKDKNGELLPDVDRMTSVGIWIRKLSLDELPQLLNVLKGDMSLIGPRPWLVEYLPLYNDYQRKRHLVKPGITGWAQIHGRNQLDWGERFKYDIYYVENLSFTLDVKIFFLTIWNIFRAKGVSGKKSVTMHKFEGNNE